MSATEVKTVPDALEAIKDAARAKTEAQAELDRLNAAFRESLVVAKRSGARAGSIAAAAGITRQRVHRLIGDVDGPS